MNHLPLLLLALLFAVPSWVVAKPDFSTAESKARMHGQEALEKSSAAISPCDLERYITLLASPEYEGRGTGGKGERMATAYLAEYFQGLGFSPAGEDDTYFQPFHVADGKEKDGVNKVRFEISGALDISREIEAGEDLEPLSFSKSGKVKNAPAIFAGFGIKAEGYDSFQGLDPKGKWLVLLRGSPNGRPKLKRFSALVVKAAEAKKLGAVGILYVNASHPDVSMEVVPPTVYVGGGSNILPAFTISDKLAATLLTGEPGSEAFTQLAKAHLEDGETRSFPLPFQVSAEVSLKTRQLPARNVLGRLQVGDSPSCEAIIIGGHIDHLGYGDKGGTRAKGEDAKKIHPGADDNASGIAAIMEVAQYFAAQKAAGKLSLGRDIIFAGWSGEEMGLHGSKHYANHPPTNTAREGEDKTLYPAISSYINLDMVGRLGEKPLLVQATGSSKTWQGLLDSITHDLETRRVRTPYLPTDSTSFYNAGVPVLSLFTGTHDEYHTPADTADKIDYSGLTQVASYVQLLAEATANLDAAPGYVKVDRSPPKVKVGIRMEDAPGHGGVKVLDVLEDSPAQLAGIQTGDIITSLDGEAVQDIQTLRAILRKMNAGEEYPVKVRRGSEDVGLKVTPSKR